MPIYEYRCTKCNKTFEKIQRITDEPLTECPDCYGALEKLISQTSFSLKGGGWYKDGYSSAKPDTVKTKNTTPEKEKKTEPKKESKKD